MLITVRLAVIASHVNCVCQNITSIELLDCACYAIFPIVSSSQRTYTATSAIRVVLGAAVKNNLSVFPASRDSLTKRTKKYASMTSFQE